METTISFFSSLTGALVVFNQDTYGLTLAYSDVPERRLITRVEQEGNTYRITYVSDFGIGGAKELSVVVTPDFKIRF